MSLLSATKLRCTQKSNRRKMNNIGITVFTDVNLTAVNKVLKKILLSDVNCLKVMLLN